MSDNKLLLHVLKKIRDTKQTREYGICGEVIHRLKKWYMVGHGFSDKGPNYSERCEAVTRVQTVLYKLMVQWPGGWYSEDDRYPVEGNEEKFGEALEAGLLWENRRRLELLGWLIKELENDAKQSQSSSQSSH